MGSMKNNCHCPADSDMKLPRGRAPKRFEFIKKKLQYWRNNGAV